MKWKIEQKDGDVYISSSADIFCYLCDEKMEPTHANKLMFDSVPYSGEKDCYAVDMYAECPSCHMEEIFGIALSKVEFDMMDLLTLKFSETN